MKTLYIKIFSTVGKLMAIHKWPNQIRKISLVHLKSLFYIGNRDYLFDNKFAWWPYKVQKEIRHIFETKSKVWVFEYGSGASTIWLRNLGFNVISVEHDKEWFRYLQKKYPSNDGSNKIIYCPPEFSINPRIESQKESFRNYDFTQYVEEINKFGDFDLIVIDGRCRVSCFEQATKHLKDGGVILFDNFKRRRYRKLSLDGFDIFLIKGLTPLLPFPSTTALIRKSEIK